MATASSSTAGSTSGRGVGSLRWGICALLFLATTINYIDRQVLSLLKPTLQQQFGWSEIDYADIVFAFQLAYAIGLLVAGRVIDRIGTRIGFALAILLWSVAAVAHAEATGIGRAFAPILAMAGLAYSGSVAGFIAVRFLLGLGEAGNFPAAIKTVAEWFPKRERALTTGIFNSGTNIGAIVAPLVVPWLTYTYGWPAAFVATGALGFLWLVLWWPIYAPPGRHPRLRPSELAYIQSDPPDPPARVPWLSIVPYRQTWAVAIAKGLTDPIWWLYLFWFPDFLFKQYGVQLKGLALPLIVIYQFATVGSIGGGWLSSSLLRRGWSVNRARKTAMLVCALAVVPVAFAAKAPHEWVAVLLVALAAAAHQGWSANVFTLASDMFPRQAVGSVVGFAGMWGAVGGMLIAKITGYVLQSTGSYVVVFLIAASAYLVAFVIVQILVPRLDPAPVESRA
ncbi:MAG TPA: MFS transporter [Vicinamibacterales bacterium]|jgi:ACS family hexuronate transporter-like MFS transporter|nr:MFS transporter [Vicinamibacterales bacterium]